MKTYLKHIPLLFALIIMALAAVAGSQTTAEAGTLSVKGVWVSCFEYADLGLNDKSESEFRTNANRLFSNIKANGCNTVYFHVRSYDDAIYPSSVTGWSTRISKNGKALPYDPLKILIDYSHKYGIQFHAWMNPYRVTQKKVLDPASEQTVNRIVAQVKEIVNKYNEPLQKFVDGAKTTETILADTYNTINNQVNFYEQELKEQKLEELKAYFDEL